MSVEFHQFLIFGSTFEVTQRYLSGPLEPVGIGASGLVCSAKDKQTGVSVAIKKISKPFASEILAKRTYRELRLLKYLKHENVISLIDAFISPSENIYFVTELLGTDLQSLIASGITDKKYIQYFMYQIMRGLKYVHSAGVAHRDLKPGNILINENCELKICDFGLARIVEKQMTEYVSTRYYRAPEIIISETTYGESVDIWSAGCIFAEMLTRKILFPSTNYMKHLSMIIDLLGSPPDEYIQSICDKKTIKLINSFPKKEAVPLSVHFSQFTPEEIEVLEKTVAFDARKRANAAGILELKYFNEFYDKEDEPVAAARFDWSFTDTDYTPQDLKNLIYKEVKEFTCII